MTHDDQLYPAVTVLDHLDVAMRAGARIRIVSYEAGGHRPVYFEDQRPVFERFLTQTVRAPSRDLAWSCAAPCRIGRVEIVALGAGASDADALPDSNVMSSPGRIRLGFQADSAFAGPGVRVDEVVEKSTAASIGLRAGDVVVALDGTETADLAALAAALGAKSYDSDVAVRVRRGGETMELRGHIAPFRAEPYYVRSAPTAHVSVQVDGARVTIASRNVTRLRILFTEPDLAAGAPAITWNGAACPEEVRPIPVEEIATQYAEHADLGMVFSGEIPMDAVPPPR
jgi:membrane-associated protease RseP (regulator of RpoE activity)